jgi:hypothetical protein
MMMATATAASHVPLSYLPEPITIRTGAAASSGVRARRRRRRRVPFRIIICRRRARRMVVAAASGVIFQQFLARVENQA